MIIYLHGNDSSLTDMYLEEMLAQVHNGTEELTLRYVDWGLLKENALGLFPEENMLYVCSELPPTPEEVKELTSADLYGSSVIFAVRAKVDKRHKNHKALVSSLPKGHVMESQLPKPWELEQYCIGMAETYAERYGGKIDKVAAVQLVQRIGPEPGRIRLEIKRLLVHLKQQKGMSTITSALVLENTARLAGYNKTLFIKALKTKKWSSMAKVLDQIECNTTGDPSMMICNQMVYHLMDWTVALTETNLDYRYENFVKPEARMIGKKNVQGLSKVVDNTLHCIFSGGRAPWALFKAQLSALPWD
jgi:hypothetical protein